eukprot:TRINITY_DN21151_c0_g1_i1.p1 TRINITY_DN21151_c0_g1~~TRINITY_DN21151_c0_g1_i1.p1  ORF type:complete len:411 (-),score=48.29 TRINITY_DN21151_c0_g1_i1:45-1277(-)
MLRHRCAGRCFLIWVISSALNYDGRHAFLEVFPFCQGIRSSRGGHKFHKNKDVVKVQIERPQPEKSEVKIHGLSSSTAFGMLVALVMMPAYVVAEAWCIPAAQTNSKNSLPYVLSPLGALWRRLFVLAIFSGAVIVACTVYLSALPSTGVLLALLIAAAIVFCLSLFMLFFLSRKDPYDKDTKSLQDPSCHGTAKTSAVFVYELPPALANDVVRRIWGCCGLRQQAAYHQLLLRECFVGLCVFAVTLFGLYSHNFFLDGSKSAHVSLFFVILLMCQRFHIILGATLRLCVYSRRALDGVTVYLLGGGDSIRLHCFEFVAPSIFSEAPRLRASVESSDAGFVFRVEASRQEGLEDIDWPCCDFKDKLLWFAIPVPEDVVDPLQDWIQANTVQNEAARSVDARRAPVAASKG